MNDRRSVATRSRRAATRSRRGATVTERTGTVAGLTNVRTRLVGDREGVAADAVVGLAKAWSTAWRLVRRGWAEVASVVTGLGWAVAAVTLVAFVVGYRSGLREVVVVGWAGTVLVLVAAVALVGRSRLLIRMRLPQHRVAVGDEAGVVVTAENPARLPSVPATVEVPVGPGLVDVAIPGIPPRGTFEQ
ncbi:hypothetical protein NS330_11080, partial [Curtobacterium citreum]